MWREGTVKKKVISVGLIKERYGWTGNKTRWGDVSRSREWRDQSLKGKDK